MKGPRDLLQWWRLPAEARRWAREDRRRPLGNDRGPTATINAGAGWLERAQDKSESHDGGVARHFDLLKGWGTSYPETTGYIVPTMLNLADVRQHPDYRERARRMLDWLVGIQDEGGGFQGGTVDAVPKVPVTFNTGQILIGLAAGERVFGDFSGPLQRAAMWLRDSQDADGCWRRHTTPFARPGDKAYETHVSWGLFEAERVAPGNGYGDAGLRQVDWALTRQRDNGWVADCCLTDVTAPLTHTLGYFLRGVVEAHRLSGERRYLDGALRTARGLLGTQRPDGSIPGRLRSDWSPAVDWICLTGMSQIAESWFYLARESGDDRFDAAARSANAYVRRTISLDGPDGVRGGVKGSVPIDGDYGRFQFLNWAVKFTIDANLVEAGLKEA